MPEESIPQEPTMQVDPCENFPEPIPNMEDDDINPPVAPELIEVENFTKPSMEGTALVPEIPDLEPDQDMQSDSVNNLDPDEVIQQPCQSS